MIQSPENKVIVSVPTRYIKNMTDLLKRSAIQNNSSVDQTDFVQITGTVISVPKRISTTRDYEGFTAKEIQPGDMVIFDYSVIYDQIIKKENEDPVYKNLIMFRGKEFWAADITRIFAIVRGEQIIMINGYVMATPFVESKIIIPASMKQEKGCVSSEVMHVGMPKTNRLPISIQPYDTIYYNPVIAQKYQINNKPFVILQQHQILGKSTPQVF